MLEEAIHIIRELHTGELITWEGDYFRVDSARIWDVPEQGVPLAVAVSGDKSIERFGALADHLIAVEPEPELISGWDEAHAEGLAQDRADADLLGSGRADGDRAGP